jgi:hypothetical protein
MMVSTSSVTVGLRPSGQQVCNTSEHVAAWNLLVSRIIKTSTNNTGSYAAFIYLAYSMMALLYERVPVLEDTWIECLGDFG